MSQTVDITKNADEVIKVVGDHQDAKALRDALEAEKQARKRSTVVAALEQRLTELENPTAPAAKPADPVGGKVSIHNIQEVETLQKHNLLEEFLTEFGSEFDSDTAGLEAIHEFMDKERNDPQNPTQVFNYRDRVIENNTHQALAHGVQANEPQMRPSPSAHSRGTVEKEVEDGDGKKVKKLFPLYNPNGPSGTHQQWEWHHYPNGSKVRISYHPDDVAAVN